MPEVDSFRVLGVRIDAIRVRDVPEIVGAWIRDATRSYVVLTGAHGVVEMQEDPELHRINEEAGLVTPDGMSVVWVGRLRGHRNVEKVYAPDVMAAVFEAGVAEGWRHYLYGGGPGVADRLAERMRDRHPGLAIAGTFTPPFRPLTETETNDVVEDIDRSRAHVVWCGLGCPKQERWMASFRPRLRAPVLIGVGAGFDFLAGIKPLAPRWVQRSGFEWLYRLASEPRRLWPRYSRVVPRFLIGLLRETLRGASTNRKCH